MPLGDAPAILNIHTPTSSFAIVHSLTQETLFDLYNKLSRKANTDYYGERVGPGWLKYEYNEAIWNLDDDSDYSIFVWRRQQQQQDEYLHAPSTEPDGPPVASSSRVKLPSPPPPTIVSPSLSMPATPTLHLRNPQTPLPVPPAYCNPAYYVFQPVRATAALPQRRSPAPSRASTGRRSGKAEHEDDAHADDGVLKLKKQFDRFHSENGVRTVMGQIGPVHNVRMLLKSGYRHVYISRKFAIKHGFIPPDTAPGNYGYGGLVNIGTWPITLTPSSTQPNLPAAGYQRPDAFNNATAPRTAESTPYSSPRAQGKTRSIRSREGGKRRGPASDGDSTVNGIGRPAGPSVGTPVMVEVYLSEEPHFDVVLGRSFIEKRQIRMHSIDPTDVVCLDTGEKIECELVILKDGRGEIVTVT
ncbi:hypothetical protein BDN70DRAFT_797240 [Pholiota conissans]|uniref:Uncharacterized protein n=1 Tax=Pholiota conissans TaxID=109636 RepID=A0A9P5ZCM2_9AGAR|nr:hypothetical protein BDN70DRAFT_797240 [Pholiota conissans]